MFNDEDVFGALPKDGNMDHMQTGRKNKKGKKKVRKMRKKVKKSEKRSKRIAKINGCLQNNLQCERQMRYEAELALARIEGVFIGLSLSGNDFPQELLCLPTGRKYEREI